MWVPESMQNDEFAAPGQEGQPKLGRFLYAMHFDEDESKVQLSVSDDGGLSFKRVYLPTVAPERFFNVLEVEEDFVFLHVDEPDGKTAGQKGHIGSWETFNLLSLHPRLVLQPEKCGFARFPPQIASAYTLCRVSLDLRDSFHTFAMRKE
ncbi:unnamed protein product [Dibothriocephalus latus]|uniref:Sortilin N-terminal domain-containing protein n=1 Tax=Dibothriocephalus latus TaxID=60516 RepID=A0A3P7NIR1_DIBLA|nr:unnamed protein product [Dibothriocephalus latus]